MAEVVNGYTSTMLRLSITILSMLVGVGCRMAEDPIPVGKPASMRNGQPFLTVDPSIFFSPFGCFHASRSYCHTEQPCYRLLPNAVLCCDVDSESLKESLALDRNFSQQVQYLHVINATMEELDVSQAIWKMLTTIAFTDGHISQIPGEFTKNSKATCLNVSNNNIINITARAFVHLSNLTMLDISYNDLDGVPRFNGKGKDFYLDFKGNNQTLCKSVVETLKTHKLYLKFVNANSTFCTSSKTFQWFNTTELVPIEQVELVQEIKKHCGEPALEIANCSCDLARLDIVAGKTPTFTVRVDCSNRNLKQLPSKLPRNTIKLNVTSNNITSLKPLSDHPSYEHVRQLYADDNNIQSILDLEGTKFIDNFIVLSLRSNKLKNIPTYILSDSFDRNWSPRQVYLGNNYLNCDCTTTRQVKLWLLSKPNNIPDYDQVMCENIPGKLIDLAESKVCPQTKDCTDYIYYVIAIEVILLFGLIAKVFYDYWVYKTAGYLPWPASEMPKLPCDWLCE